MAELMTDDERKFYRTQTELAENQIKFLKKQLSIQKKNHLSDVNKKEAIRKAAII